MDTLTPEQTNQLNNFKPVENQQQQNHNLNQSNSQTQPQNENLNQQIETDEELARRLQAEEIIEYERERQRRLWHQYQQRLILNAQRRLFEYQLLQSLLQRAIQQQNQTQSNQNNQTSEQQNQVPQPQNQQQTEQNQVPQPQNNQQTEQINQQQTEQNNQQQNEMEGVTFIHTQQPILIIQNGDSEPVILSTQPVFLQLRFNFLEPEMSYEDLLRLQERLGNVNRGASPDDINKNTKTFKVVEIPKEINCVICQSEFQKDEEVRMLPCKHSYHKDCIDQWLKINKLCPICKKDITETQQN